MKITFGDTTFYQKGAVKFIVSRGKNEYYRILYIKPIINYVSEEEIKNRLEELRKEFGFSNSIACIETTHKEVRDLVDGIFANISPEIVTPKLSERVK
ncbi:MAG TPA: hypothetical protein PLP33_24665 [Leptospiraceae bacterium]|nr:hypothetical protein [Leptospiraceae bacterium]